MQKKILHCVYPQDKIMSDLVEQQHLLPPLHNDFTLTPLKLDLHWSFHVIFDEDHDKNVRKFPSYFYPPVAQIKFFGCDGPNRETVS